VIQTVRLDTGTYLVEKLEGRAELDVQNTLDLDAVVVLALASEPETPLVAFYVQSQDRHKFKGVKGGFYVLYLAVGEGWGEDSQKFLTEAAYYRFKGEMEFISRRRTWTVFTVVLEPGIIEVFAQPISEEEFPTWK